MSRQRYAFNLSTGADTGGAAIREVEAFRSPAGLASRWRVRSMVAGGNYINYPEDLAYGLDSLRQNYEQADVVHLNHTLHGWAWYDRGQFKPIVLEHHGLHKDAFDIDFDGSIAQGIEVGARQIGSTANLELFGPPGTILWTPIPYDLAWLQSTRRSSLAAKDQILQGHGLVPGSRPRLRVGEPLIIAHAPTNRVIKSTDAFIAAIEALKASGLKVEGLLIEKKTHPQCMRLKGIADILVDQLQLGYGCNAIEAWGMGIPVVGGVADPVWREHMVARWGSMPLYEATEATLEGALRKLVKSSLLRSEYASLGVAHFERHHTQAGHVQLMSKVYESTSPTVQSNKRSGPRMTHQERLNALRARRRQPIARRS